MDLREDKHWSYGASSSLSDARGQQALIASAAVERGHTADAIKEMNKDLHQVLTTEPPTAAEIDFAKRTQVMTLPGEFESTDQVNSAIQHLVEFDLPDDYWNALVPRIMSQTPQQLAAAAALMLHPDQLTWVIVGDLSKIEAPIRALKIGDVQVLDADGNPLHTTP
jgi:predicted Zn-dependent peptidase